MFAGDFSSLWNGISGDSQDLNQNSSTENALGINGKRVFYFD